jgi:exodeoxyribonuclease VII small subunit
MPIGAIWRQSGGFGKTEVKSRFWHFMSRSRVTDPEALQPAQSAAADPASFEHAMAELEALVQKMESGDLSLEQSLSAYQRGAVLVAFCRNSLVKVQQQVKILEGDLLKPFEADAEREN